MAVLAEAQKLAEQQAHMALGLQQRMRALEAMTREPEAAEDEGRNYQAFPYDAAGEWGAPTFAQGNGGPATASAAFRHNEEEAPTARQCGGPVGCSRRLLGANPPFPRSSTTP